MPHSTLWIALLTFVAFASTGLAQPQSGQNSAPPAAPVPDPAQDREADAQLDPAGGVSHPAEVDAVRDQRFATYMTGAKLVGRFTVMGSEQTEGKQEEYLIRKCEKLPEGDLFRFTARIRYGDTDTEVPMDLPVKWAGGTPVISLDNVWIPGLGTFSSHVIIRRDRYAGTWDHGDKGGHLFGRIERIEEGGQ